MFATTRSRSYASRTTPFWTSMTSRAVFGRFSSVVIRLSGSRVGAVSVPSMLGPATDTSAPCDHAPVRLANRVRRPARRRGEGGRRGGGLDLTVEAITHRFTDNSRAVLQGWYPRTRLEMDEQRRTRKRTRFGGSKYVYPREVISELRGWFGDAVAARLPDPRTEPGDRDGGGLLAGSAGFCSL